MKRLVILLAIIGLHTTLANAQTSDLKALPSKIEAGQWKAGHIQGIAVDTKREHIYFSFTTILIKTDLQGNIIGTVSGLLGHLGCIEFNDEDGRLYGSLEYKYDSIGKGILKQEGVTKRFEDGFYVAIFDVDKIDRMDMNAERDGVMTTVFLHSVLADYQATVEHRGQSLKHRYGCSGFDGISFGPRFGKSADNKHYLTIAYGIYGDASRSDNDYQVLLQYDTSDWSRYEYPLSQENMHRNGPTQPDARYLVYTGNKNWGVQNLEYDPHTRLWLLATYESRKPGFADLRLFAVSANEKGKIVHPKGIDYTGKERVLALAEVGVADPANPAIRGWAFDASVGLCSLGDGRFYIAKKQKGKGWQSGRAELFKFSPDSATPFVEM